MRAYLLICLLLFSFSYTLAQTNDPCPKGTEEMVMNKTQLLTIADTLAPKGYEVKYFRMTCTIDGKEESFTSEDGVLNSKAAHLIIQSTGNRIYFKHIIGVDRYGSEVFMPCITVRIVR